MSEIKVTIAQNTRRESVLINPKINPIQNGPASKEQFDEQGVQPEVDNILATGTNRKEVLKKVYGGL